MHSLKLAGDNLNESPRYEEVDRRDSVNPIAPSEDRPTSPRGYVIWVILYEKKKKYTLYYCSSSFLPPKKPPQNYRRSGAYDDKLASRTRARFGITSSATVAEQKVALLWAILASYLPEGTDIYIF